MANYFLRRFLILIPTLIGITLVVFMIINMAPGGPIEQMIIQQQFGGAGADSASSSSASVNKSDSYVPDEVIEAMKKQYGLDKPIHIRYKIWIQNIINLDFGESFTYEEDVLDVIIQKFPVSLQFGIASLLLSYLICIPLGVLKAIKNGTNFDLGSSLLLIIMYSIPSFMLGILLLVFFAGGSFFDWFPIGGLISDDYDEFTMWGKIWDRIHHFVLPLICYVIGSFTTLTLLMKNSLLEEIRKDYVRTAKAKGFLTKLFILSML